MTDQVQKRHNIRVSQTKNGNFITRPLTPADFDSLGGIEVGGQLIIRLYDKDGDKFGYFGIIPKAEVDKFKAENPQPVKNDQHSL